MRSCYVFIYLGFTVSLMNLPAHSEVSFCGNPHDQEGSPRHQDVLDRVPEVWEHVDIHLDSF